MKRKLLLRESLFASIFIFFGLAVLIQITISLHVFDPFYRSFNDFEFTDLIYSRFNQPAIDTNIVIINIGKLERAEIAGLINKIDNQKPKVIGVDAFFVDLRDPLGDIALKDALSNTDNVVLAAKVIDSHDEDTHGEAHFEILKSNEFFGKINYGAVNLFAEKAETYRHFKSFIEDEHRLDFHSFATEIVEDYDNEAYSDFRERKNEKEIITYKGNLGSFIHFDHNEVLDSTTDLSILKNRIVLLGYLNEHIDYINDLEDIFFTPVNPVFSGRSNPDMKGVVIHANIISMILDRDYIDKFPAWLNWIIAFIVCFLHVVLFMYYYVEKHKWFHPVAKVVQLVTSILIVWIVFLLYKNFHIEFDSKITVIVVLLSVDLLYFYDGFVKFFARKFNYKSYIIEYHH